jgi:acyl dehydratase
MFFEDFSENFMAKTKGRTVSEADIVIFSSLTGAYNSLFLNEEYASKTRFGGRIAPGLLTASIATGLVYQLPQSPFEEGFIALVGSSFKALKSVKIGDTIRCEVSLKQKSERKENGLVVLLIKVFNQRDELVMELEHTILVEKRH